jgi:ubiquinone/menaquinone biosynthesis C-methylase UbiE
VRTLLLKAPSVLVEQPLLFAASTVILAVNRKWFSPFRFLPVMSLNEALMAESQIRFDDGLSYEQYMGDWSRRAGSVFLDWLAVPSGLRWIDVGCGNGAFTELLVERCAPTLANGIDPSEAQLNFARKRSASRLATFDRGDAMALPFPGDAFDAAIMALVIFFVPDPAKGVAEMVRVVRPSGMVAAYAWDILGGGFPLEPIRIEMRAMGLTVLSPPNSEASRIEVLRDLWTGAGLDEVEMREITVQRTFADFENFWAISLSAPSMRSVIATMASNDIELLKVRVRAALPADAMGGITYSARANAVKGRVPK